MIATLSIWGIIGYKITTALNPEIPSQPGQQMQVNFKPESNTEKDTFSIEMVPRDPFLGTIYRKANNSPARNTERSTVEWPQVTYAGVVKITNTKDQVFVVNINAKQYLLKKGQKMQEVVLLNGNSKEIIVKYKNQQKTIELQK